MAETYFHEDYARFHKHSEHSPNKSVALQMKRFHAAIQQTV